MIFAALFFVFGAWIVQQMAYLPTVAWLLGASSFVAFAILLQFRTPLLRQSKRLKLLCSCLIALVLGFCWAASFALWRLSDELPRHWEQKTIEVVGVVASLPEETEHGTRFRFDVEQVLSKSAVVPQHISLSNYRNNFYSSTRSVQSSLTFHAGERWHLKVRLKRPHGTQNPHGFDFEAWALSENIRATGNIKSSAGNQKLGDFVWRPSYVVEHLRELTKQRIANILKDKPYSGIIQALVMGEDNQIHVDDWQVFLTTGTSHLMSISGLHITMLAGLAYAMMSFIWRRLPSLVMRLPARKAATIAGVLTALIYALIAGFSVPSQRTFYMLLVLAVALWSGRQFAISQVLALALLMVVLIDPWAVNAPGFWLSFGAVAMLAYTMSGRIGQLHWFKAACITQWAVTIGMLPLLLVMFGQVSVISPVANAIAIPVISFVVTPLALLGSFLPIDVALNFSYQVLSILMVLLKWLNALPMAAWQQHAPPTWTLLPAILGVLWILLPKGWPMRWLGIIGFLPLFLITPVRPMMGAMKLTVLDVGQGLSAVVQTSTHTLLYDSGAKYSEQSDAGSRVIVPYLRGEGVKKLDGFIVSHNDNDHSGGMQSMFKQLPVSWFLSSFSTQVETPQLTSKGSCAAGQSWVWDNVHFEMLYPDLASYADDAIKDNNRSCVLKVTSQAGSVLLTGDIEKEAELDLVLNNAEVLKSDVMIVPHHGSKTSSTPRFVEAVSPSVSIFTVGYLNRFRHPKSLISERYAELDSLQYRSDYHGALELQFANDLNQQAGISVASWRVQNRRYWHDDYTD